MQITNFFAKAVLLVIFCFFISSVCGAATVKTQGVGEVNYSGWGGPSAKVKREARKKAKLNALKKYIGTFDTSKREVYENTIESEIISNLDRYVINCRVIDDYTNKDSKVYRVVVEAEIESTSIEVKIQKNSVVQQVSSENRSYMTYIFIPRKVISVKSYDKKVVKQLRNREGESEKDEQSFSHTGNGASSSSTYEKKIKLEYGGSSEQKSDHDKFEVGDPQDLQSAIEKVFSRARYEIVDPEEEGLELNVQNFKDDFATGKGITGKTKRVAVKRCRNAEIYLLGYGTMDIGSKGTDPSTGLVRVYVTVTGKVLNLHGRFSKTIASVGPVQYAGLGPNQSVASRNALKLACEKAAESLVSQLRAKNIK